MKKVPCYCATVKVCGQYECKKYAKNIAQRTERTLRIFLLSVSHNPHAHLCSVFSVV